MGDPIVEISDNAPPLRLHSTLSTLPAVSHVTSLFSSSPKPDSITTSTETTILETFKNSHKFFHSLRGLTILLSIILLATLFLVSIGFLFCCCLKRYKRVKQHSYDVVIGSEQIVGGGGGGGGPSKNGNESKSGSWKRLKEGSTGTSSDGARSGSKKLLISHKNIITPDKSVPFVVPMISLHQTQAQGPKPGPSSSVYYGNGGGSGGGGNSGSNIRVVPPMLEEQYFPQYHLEDTTAPQIGFSLSYQVSSQVLRVRIIGGNNFPYESEGSCYSVHVKVYPGRGNKQKTKEFPGSCPIYNQEFSFHVRKDTLRTKVLKLRIIGQNFSINTSSSATNPPVTSSSSSGSKSSVVGRASSFIGSSSIVSTGSTLSGASTLSGSSTGKILVGIINLALKDIPAVGQYEDVKQDFKTGPIWKILEHPSSYGEGIKLEVSLKWAEEPSPGLLVMKIREAYGLHEITEAEYTTTYVKVTLQEQGRSIKNRKTRLIRWGNQPNYDDTFVVTIPYELLSQISFTLSLIARGRLGSKVILGKINVGPVPFVNPQSGFAAGAEIWEDMCHKKNEEVCRWLPLMIP